MNLSELYADLSYGELSNLSMAVEGTGTIQEEARPRIIRAANDALLQLYGRFNLSEKDLLLETYEHITNYHLISRFSESGGIESEEPYLYIKDHAGDPFLDDVIKVLAVCDSLGRDLPLNDAEATESVFTPQYNILQVPRPLNGVSLGVMYQARHPKLEDGDDDQEISIPPVLEGALRAYIAYKIYGSINTQESMAMAQGHMAMYEAICTGAEEKDLVNTSISQTNSKFEKRGFA